MDKQAPLGREKMRAQVFALREAKRVLKSKMDILLSQARELERMLQRLDEQDSKTSKADLFNWAVNDLNNVLLNLACG